MNNGILFSHNKKKEGNDDLHNKIDLELEIVVK